MSTDEVYYASIDGKCGNNYNPVNRSLKWVECVQTARDFAKSRGRRILVWAEYPLLPEHVKMIPPDVIDGVMGNEAYLKTENEMGMRQLSYNSMHGGGYLFPSHLSVETERGLTPGNLERAFQNISSGRVQQGKPIGVFGAAWDDNGLHNETFWLGWSAVAQYGWIPGRASVEQHVAEFMSLYYGPRATGMVEIYRGMQRQARSWERTWDRITSKARGPGYGNSYGKGVGTERHDWMLAAPGIPQMPDLRLQTGFAEKYSKYVEDARRRSLENDQLTQAIQANFPRVDRNRYNLEVFLVLARFMGHHWRLLLGLDEAEGALQQAQAAAQKNNPRLAVGYLVAAHNRVDRLQKENASIFEELRAVFEKSRYHKGRSVGGRNFVRILDDTKDHWADRRPDLTYMIAPEQAIGLETWQKELDQVMQAYAKQNNVPVRGLREARLEE